MKKKATPAVARRRGTPRLERFGIGYVIWNDACSDFRRDSYDPMHDAQVVVTAGWILKESASGVTMCKDALEDGRFRTHTFIPRGMIVRVVTVKRALATRDESRVTLPGHKFIVK